MTMCPLYPCSTGTHNENSEKPGPIFCNNRWNYGFESQARGSVFCFSVESKVQSHLHTVTIVIHKSSNLIGTVGIAKFGPKKGQAFRVIL